MKGGFLYSLKENKVFVSTNARFLEYEHIRNHRTNNKVVLEQLETDDQNDEIIIGQAVVRSDTTQIE